MGGDARLTFGGPKQVILLYALARTDLSQTASALLV